MAPETLERKDCDDFADYYYGLYPFRLINHLKFDALSPDQKSIMMTNDEFIVRIMNKAREKGRLCMVVLLPDENQINRRLQRDFLNKNTDMRMYDFDMPQSALSAAFAKYGITTIDMLPAFRADGRCLYRNDTHWGPEGHALVASQITAAVGPAIEAACRLQ